MSSGCPKCGAERLKSSAIPVVDPVVRLLTGGRRRYRCVACGWIGRRHRLTRRSFDMPSLAPKRAPAGRAVSFFAVVLLFLLITGTVVIRQCAADRRASLEQQAGNP